MFMVMLETTEGVNLATSMALVNITEADSECVGVALGGGRGVTLGGGALIAGRGWDIGGERGRG